MTNNLAQAIQDSAEKGDGAFFLDKDRDKILLLGRPPSKMRPFKRYPRHQRRAADPKKINEYSARRAE